MHYPFISKDMISKIENNKDAYNNNKRIADSKVLSSAKIYYYKGLLWAY